MLASKTPSEATWKPGLKRLRRSVLIGSAVSGVLHRRLLSLGRPVRERRAEVDESTQVAAPQRLSRKGAGIAVSGERQKIESASAANRRERAARAPAARRQGDLAPVQIPV